MGTLWLAVGLMFEIRGADTQERVDRAGGSSRVLAGVGWLGGFVDLLDCLALREVSDGVRVIRPLF